MSFFTFFKKPNPISNYELFAQWLDKVMQQDLPKGIKAYNFNIYENNKNYQLQLIGSDEYDFEDADWACSDFFTTEENLFILKRTKDIAKWEDGLSYTTSLVKKYLSEGKFAEALKKALAVTVGFVDGDLETVYTKNSEN